MKPLIYRMTNVPLCDDICTYDTHTHTHIQINSKAAILPHYYKQSVSLYILSPLHLEWTLTGRPPPMTFSVKKLSCPPEMTKSKLPYPPIRSRSNRPVCARGCFILLFVYVILYTTLICFHTFVCCTRLPKCFHCLRVRVCVCAPFHGSPNPHSSRSLTQRACNKAEVFLLYIYTQKQRVHSSNRKSFVFCFISLTN